MKRFCFSSLALLVNVAATFAYNESQSLAPLGDDTIVVSVKYRYNYDGRRNLPRPWRELYTEEAARSDQTIDTNRRYVCFRC